MLLSEPPRSPMDVSFVLFGVPVRIHPLFWLSGVVLNLQGGDDMLGMLLWLVAFLLSFLVHEMGHAAAIRAYGHSPWITLYAFGGLTSHNPAYDCGSRRSSTPWAQIQISAAGPLSEFVLAAVILVAIHLAGHAIALGGPLGLIPLPAGTVISPRFTHLIEDLVSISIFWGALNLVPVLPLDGGQIARELFSLMNPRDGVRQSLILSMVTAVALAVVAVAKWNSLWSALFFGLLAYESYTAYQFYGNRDPW